MTQMMLVSKWVLAISIHFFPVIAGQLEGSDDSLGVLKSRGTEGALEEVEKSLKETLERMKESLGADLQVQHNLILARMAMEGKKIGNEVIITFTTWWIQLHMRSSPTGGRANFFDYGSVGEKGRG